MIKHGKETSPRREYVISLDHRKARGAGCERPGEILKAARELFLTRGAESVTTRQIAARVGISQTALYVYFSSKEQMLDALAEEAWRSLADALAAADPNDAEGSDPVSRLRAILSAYMRFWLRRPDDYRIIFMRKSIRPCPSDDDTRFAARDGLLARLAERFKEAAQAGLARDSWLPEAAALAMWAAVSGPVALRLAFPDLHWPPEDEHVMATIDMIIQGCDGRGQKGAAKALEPTAGGAALLNSPRNCVPAPVFEC
jgi:AcrR family transcriptional regulator